MMEAIRSYLTAVVAVSMIAVLASALSHGSRMERVVRFAAGLLALLVCVTPLLRLDARTLTDVLEQAERALDYDASKTDRTRQDMLRDLIRENTERTTADGDARPGAGPGAVGISVAIARHPD